jgi:hypothetical protein
MRPCPCKQVDLIFTKAKAKGARKISYEQFKGAVDAVAAKKGVAFADVAKAIAEAGGPVDGGTKAEAVRLHDDKVRASRRRRAGARLALRPATLDRMRSHARRHQRTPRACPEQATRPLP